MSGRGDDGATPPSDGSARRRVPLESVRIRAGRLSDNAFVIGQAAVAAAVAYLIARQVLGHAQPFFAPVAAIVALGLSYGARLRRMIEVIAGVAIGVAVGDAFVQVAGTGAWQIALVVVVAMTIAVLLDAGALITTQAAVQSVIVTTLANAPGAGFTRWLDALVGGLCALAVAVAVPARVVHRPRTESVAVLHELADVLREAAASARHLDLERANATLERARATESAIDSLRRATADGLDVTRSSPLRRRERAAVAAVESLFDPLDRAVRNTRVLVRRVRAAAVRGEPVPHRYLELIDELAVCVDELAAELAEAGSPEVVRVRLRELAQHSADAPISGDLSSIVVLAQVRSITVDLLEVTGLDVEQALGAMPPPPNLTTDGRR